MTLDPLTLHVASALLALATGAILYILPRKGNAWHRRLGILSAFGLFVTGATGLMLYGLTGGFNFLHILSLVTLVSVSFGLFALVRWRRTRNPAWLIAHYRSMSGAYTGLLIALALRILPSLLGGEMREMILPATIVLLILAQGSVQLLDRLIWRPTYGGAAKRERYAPSQRL
ncbi:hypothetical protein VZ95_14305 [Elstera litoralis]|uniref:DUF2306 domain-containing protein n=1 Tax=Elstera litoralis TaxID=552518 RepID=A0A0F3IQH4_9PROT|nr:DUF2306 domain-containing protein [Elstera litoralis]KJV08981.1 hypothetical protein VZ95_14305 [Elstera litoralis]